MELDHDDLRLKVARLFLSARQPLGAAVLLAEAARGGSRDPEVWCGLGAALMGSRGVLVSKPFEDWAALVFRDAPSFAGTPYAEVAAEWQASVPAPARAEPLTRADLDELLRFLLVTEDVLVECVDGLAADDQMFAVMVIVEASPHASAVARAAILGRWGMGAARSALKRVAPLLDRVDVRAAITEAARGPHRDELRPYLASALQQISKG
ncbi:MAG: hypothetical protein F9K40_01895 [Kofleriaceae bacterium]|nr:MAG: hypothetical protein F9K40_01895 [Kofleriaceae bacterium]